MGKIVNYFCISWEAKVKSCRRSFEKKKESFCVKELGPRRTRGSGARSRSRRDRAPAAAEPGTREPTTESCGWKYSSPLCWALSSTGSSPRTRRRPCSLEMAGGGPDQGPRLRRTRASGHSRWRRQTRRSTTYTRGSRSFA